MLLNLQGDALREQGDLAEADPSNAGWQRDQSFSLTTMAQSHERRGERAKALRFAEESLTIGEHLAALDRSNVTWQNDVAFSRALVTRMRG